MVRRKLPGRPGFSAVFRPFPGRVPPGTAEGSYPGYQFATVDTLTYLKAAGRIKGTAAFFGNIMGVKPIFISDRKGNNLTVNKVKGTKASLNELFEGIKNAFVPGETTEVFIGQGMAMERAEGLKKRIEEELNLKATIQWIGPIVGTTCGPGVIATFCRGKEVTRYEGDNAK